MKLRAIVSLALYLEDTVNVSTTEAAHMVGFAIVLFKQESNENTTSRSS